MSRFNGNCNVALKSAHTLRKLIMDVCVTHPLDEKRALLAKRADASLIKLRSRVQRSKGHNRAKWSRTVDPIFMAELPLSSDIQDLVSF